MRQRTTKFNVFDEALVDAEIETVYQEMISEFSGGKKWWKHLWESTSRNGIPITSPGGSLNITVHSFTDARFAARTISIKEKEKLEIEFFSGDFVGYAIWLWSPAGSKTRVSQEWHASPNSLKLKMLSRIVNIENVHSSVIQGGFTALNAYLKNAAQFNRF